VANRSPRPYVLRGLLCCGLCNRRMEGTWNHQQAHYRCRFLRGYALANHVDHPPTVYLREGLVLLVLDSWLARLFAPAQLDHTCQLLAGVSGNLTLVAKQRAAQRTLADCDARLARYRATPGRRR
jgi:site-specific DNA recombinase